MGAKGGSAAGDSTAHHDSRSVRLSGDSNQTITIQSAPPPKRIKLFSGTKPTPAGEQDFNSFKLTIEKILDDSEKTMGQQRDAILDNLTGDAQILCTGMKQRRPEQILNHLKQIYGCVTSSKELLVSFYNMNQELKEENPQYLQRLYKHLLQVNQEGGIALAEISKELLEQFDRGCSDADLLNKLDIDTLLQDPPSFGDLIQKVRVAEAKRVKQRLRQKNAQLNMQLTQPSDMNSAQAPVSNKQATKKEQKLQNQVEALQASLQALQTQVSHSQYGTNQQSGGQSQVDPTSSSSQQHRGSGSYRGRYQQRQRPDFCFRCGEKNHYAVQCPNPANEERVSKLFAELRNPTQGN